MNIHRGLQVECAVLAPHEGVFVPTGEYIPVEIREIKTNSVRVKTLVGKTRYLWVKREMIRHWDRHKVS